MSVAAAPLIETRDLRVAYDGVEVLHGIDLAVDAGQVLAVLGPNGAGKTTLLSTLAGLVRPASGSVHYGGRDGTDFDPATLAAHGVCCVPEGRGIFPNLTVAEHLWLLAGRDRPRAGIEERAFALFPGLADRRGQLAGSLSGGEQQMLALARALVTDPAVLLVDELSMGLAPLVIGMLYELVAEIATTGVTIVLVEQFVATVAGIADRGVALVGGRLVLDGTIEAISPRLRDAYFASSEESSA